MQSLLFARLAAGVVALTAVAAVTGLTSLPSRAAADVDQIRTLPPFDRIQTDGAFSVNVFAGRSQRVVVNADPSIVDHVTTRVDHGRLEVGIRPGTSDLFHRQPHLTIELPALRDFTNEGAGSVTIAGVSGNSLGITNDGAARVRAAGRVGTLTISLDGVGLIDTTGLAARDVTVDNNGVGRVDVRAIGNLTMTVDGIGEIRYAGSPASVTRHVNGIGRIERL